MRTIIITIIILWSSFAWSQELSYTTTIDHVPCAGDCSSTLTIEASGGVSPYKFAINGGSLQDSNSFDNLCPGEYDIQIIDSITNEISGSITIVAPSPLTTTITVFSSGTEPSGIIVLNPSGGEPPYSYAINYNAFTETSSFYNLSPGSYILTVQDALGCFIMTEVFVEDTGIDNSLSQDGDLFTTTIEANSYQWYDAELQEAINGETARTFKSNRLGLFRVEMTFNDDNFSPELTNNTTISSPTYEVSAILSAGISQTASKITIYPNPATDKLHLSTTVENATYTIYTVSGKKVISGLIENRTIAIENLKSGLYFLHLKNGRTFKFVKQ